MASARPRLSRMVGRRSSIRRRLIWDALVDVGHHARDLVRHGRLGDRDARAQPVQVHLGGGQEGAQLIVQFARQARLLVLGHTLQVGGEVRQLPRALAHHAVELLAFLFELVALPLGGGQAPGVLHAQHHQQDDVDRGDQRDAVARQRQIALGVLQAARHRTDLALAQPVQALAHRLHRRLAEIRADQVQRHLQVALAVDQRELHLGELAADLQRGIGEQLQRFGVVGVVVADFRHQRVDVRDGLVVGIEVLVLAREQEAALTGLRVDEFGEQFIDGGFGLLRLDHLPVALAQANVARLGRNQHAQRQQDAAGKQQGGAQR